MPKAISSRAQHYRGFQRPRRQRVRHTSSGFSPGDGSISGLTAWYDFSDITTLFQDTARTSPITADAQVILGVADKSGGGFHLSEATNGPTYKAAIQNGRSIARFDGTNDVLGGAKSQTTTAHTIFMVAKTSTVAGVDIFGLVGAVDGYGLRINGTNARAIVFPGVAEKVDAAANNTTCEIWVTRYTTDSTLYVNGGSAQSITNAASDPAAPSGATNIVGGAFGAFWNGDFSEGLIYNSELSLANTNIIGAYLGAKWGLTWTAAV